MLVSLKKQTNNDIVPGFSELLSVSLRGRKGACVCRSGRVLDISPWPLNVDRNNSEEKLFKVFVYQQKRWSVSPCSLLMQEDLV